MSYTQDWFSNNIPIWQQFLLRLTGQPLKALEIGCFEGRATVWLLENILTNPESTITCIDTFKGSPEFEGKTDMIQVKENFWENTAKFNGKVTLIEGKSQEILKTIGEEFDLIYVDGSHTSADTLTDAVLCDLLLKKGGILIFDDYLWGNIRKSPEVPKGAIDAFMDNFCEKYNPLHIGYQVLLQKK